MPNINKNIIMQAGAAVANATNKAAGLTAATPEPGAIISAIQLVNGGRTIGPDALAHFTESVRNKLLSLLVSMEPIQDFNEYGHPWPAGGGVNKFGGAINTLFPLSLQSGTVLIVSADLGGASYGVLRTYDSSETFLQSVLIQGNFGSRHYAALTLSSDISYVKVEGNTLTDIQVEIAPNASALPSPYSPYANICPISGRTGLHVYEGPTSSIGDASTYSMDWTSPAGTVYAGSADIVTGDIKAAPYYASYNGETLVGPWVSSKDVYDPEGTPATGAQVVDLGGTMTEYHITGQDIITLVGDNYIWSDSGDVTITE